MSDEGSMKSEQIRNLDAGKVDGRVDAADHANNADNADKYDGVSPSDGSADQAYTTDGSTGSFSNIKLNNSIGTGSGQINSEVGSYDPSGGQFTATISLANKYLDGLANVGFSPSSNLGGSDIVGVTGYTTDNDGNIVSFTIEGNSDNDEETAEWKFFGVIA